MKDPILIKEPWPRIIGIPLVGIILSIVFKDSEPYSMENLFTSIAITGIMWQGDYMIIMWLRRRWPILEKTMQRLLVTVLLVCAYNLSADYFLCDFLFNHKGDGYDSMKLGFGPFLVRNLGTTFIIGTLYEAGYFFKMWQRQTLETEQIKSQQLRSELSVLRDQISPHFLFNSLNTLITLIHENQEQAARFTAKLSEVYRYTLSHKELEVVNLKKEMAFTDAYFYLMKIRFEDRLQIENMIGEAYMNYYVAPLTVQMLVENALKHNIVSNSKPLKVKVYIEDERWLVVENNLQRKNHVEGSMGLGLANIRLRYSLLSNMPVEIFESANTFKVALPLLKIVQEQTIRETVTV